MSGKMHIEAAATCRAAGEVGFSRMVKRSATGRFGESLTASELLLCSSVWRWGGNHPIPSVLAERMFECSHDVLACKTVRLQAELASQFAFP